jgi:hypothetical protein
MAIAVLHLQCGQVVALKQLRSCPTAMGKHHNRFIKEERKPRSGRMQEEPLGRAEEDFAATLYDGTIALPFAQEAACGERRNICCARQLLVRGIEFETI